MSNKLLAPAPPRFGDFTDLQLRAIEALADAPTIAEAARAADVSRTAIYNWLKDRAFADRVRDARHEALRHGVGILHYGAQRAAIALVDVVDDAESPATARVSAARTLLAHAYTGYDMDYVDRKIAEIEEARREIEKVYGPMK